MAPALPRLKRRAEFLRVAGAKRKWATPGLVLQARRREGASPPGLPDSTVRVGFTVSKKVGKAVVRNRARRRLRAAADRVLAEQAKPGYDFVLIGRAATVSRPFADLVRDLETALRRVKARRGDQGDPERRGRAPGGSREGGPRNAGAERGPGAA
ncbi:MAG: ribonuclease P protein component [Hyphomicrobiales bacterium]|nr:ribonuclease P protein component [Hyphomicrobiales bacterium]